MIPLQRSAFLEGFECLGDTCPDTCCKGWGMQLDPPTREKYITQAPELVEAVTTGEAEWIMKRDPATDYCVKFDRGLCAIHRDRGTEFLGDACHFFPRITRSLGETHVMTAALSCPEITRRALFDAAGFSLAPTQTERLPWSLMDYLPHGMDEAVALGIHTAFLDAAADAAATPERIMARIGSVARSLQMQPQESWGMAVPFYLAHADGRLPAPEEHAADPFHLIHALAGLMQAARPSARPRLEQTLHDMEAALNIAIHPETLALEVHDSSPRAYLALRGAWKEQWSDAMAPVLRRWIQAQLAACLFPFAGLGNTLSDRIAILTVRFATVRLALMSACHAHGGIPPEAETIRVIQSIARFLDHLADPTLSLAIYQETGWTLEARARGLLGE